MLFYVSLTNEQLCYGIQKREIFGQVSIQMQPCVIADDIRKNLAGILSTVEYKSCEVTLVGDGPIWLFLLVADEFEAHFKKVFYCPDDSDFPVLISES